jgi:hypothetical protein
MDSQDDIFESRYGDGGKATRGRATSGKIGIKLVLQVVLTGRRHEEIRKNP